MKKKIDCIMLIDDNKNDNFIHERTIRKNDSADTVIVRQSGYEALEYLNEKKNNVNKPPDLIFLDINMPGMNGWEFLEEYYKLGKELQSKMIVVMLTTSENPDDRERALHILPEFRTKPLTKEMLDEIILKYF